MKIFNNNLNNNYKTVVFKEKKIEVGFTKYLPSYSKEWKNMIYCYEKNYLKNLPVNDININKIISSYFNLYFKDWKRFVFKKKKNRYYRPLRKKRLYLRRIFVSYSEIRHTNNKVIINLYIINKEKKILKKKYISILKIIKYKYLKNWINLFNKFLPKIFSKYINEKSKINNKKIFLRKYLLLNNISLRMNNFTENTLKDNKKRYLNFLKKYELIYSLNQYKFNKKTFLPKLSNILNKIIGKKIEYNIINLKSISYSTDLFIKAIALKLKKRKNRHYLESMMSIINKTSLPKLNLKKERIKIKNKLDPILNKYRDLKIISYLNQINDLDKWLISIYNSSSDLYPLIYNSIDYKKLKGIKLVIKGRLTKRYRADRSVYSLKWKGGLKNEDASFFKKSSVLYRGNLLSNVSSSRYNSKRRIGAFAITGWIGGIG